MQPPIHQQKEDLQRKEEMRREEQERRFLESQLQSFDAYAFYDQIGSWAEKKVKDPITKSVQISLLQTKKETVQPLPINRQEFYEMKKLTTSCSQLLQLLRAIDQKGIECPYVHQLNRNTIERALLKCDVLEQAHNRFKQGEGLFSLFKRLLYTSFMISLKKEVASLRGKLESLIMLCRHQEFAQDLMKLRRAVTYRTGALLGPDDQLVPVRRPPPQRQEPMRRPLQGRPSRLGLPPSPPTP